MDHKDIFVSVDGNQYRKSKTDLLSAKIDVLTSMKRLNNLRKLLVIKSELKNQLQKLFISATQAIERVQERIPRPQVPREFKPKAPEKVEVAPEVEKEHRKARTIEQELLEIQEKLNALNM